MQIQKEVLEASENDESDEDFMFIPFYVWLKTNPLEGHSCRVVLSTFEAFRKFDIDDVNALKTLGVSVEHFLSMGVSFDISLRIATAVKECSDDWKRDILMKMRHDGATGHGLSMNALVPPYHSGELPIRLCENNKHNNSNDTLNGYIVGANNDEKSGSFEQSVVIKLCDEKESLVREREILTMLNSSTHSPVVKIHDSPDDYLVLERIELDLGFAMQRHVQVDFRRPLTMQLVNAVEFLHEYGVAHCDLNPSTILLKQEGAMWKLMLSGLGSAVRINYENDRSYIKLTRGWVSPEVFCGRISMSSCLQIDLFHVGLLIEVLFRRSCDPDATVLPLLDHELTMVFQDFDELMTKFTCCGYLHGDLVRKLCALEPDNRGTIKDAKKALVDLEYTLYRSHKNTDIREAQSGQTIVLASLDVTMHVLESELEQGILYFSKDCLDTMVKQFEDVRSGLEVGLSTLQGLLRVHHEVTSNGAELECLSQAFVNSLVCCTTHMSEDTKACVRRASNHMKVAFMAIFFRECYHDDGGEILDMINSCIEMLNSLSSSSNEVQSTMEVLHRNRQLILDATCEVLLGGRKKIVGVVHDFAEIMTKLTSKSVKKILHELKNKCLQDGQLGEFVECVSDCIEESQQSVQCLHCNPDDSEFLIVMSQLGNQILTVLEEITLVQVTQLDQYSDLMSEIGPESGSLAEKHATSLFKCMKIAHCAVNDACESVLRARQRHDLSICINAAIEELKAWYFTAVYEANECNIEEVKGAIRAQHILSSKTLLELQKYLDDSKEACRQDFFDKTKGNVVKLLTDVGIALREALSGTDCVSSCCSDSNDSAS